MRRTAATLVALTLTAGACSGEADPPPEPTTDALATTTTTTVATTTSTTTPTTTALTTTTAPTTTASTTPVPVGGPPGTPVNELSSFSAATTIEVDLAGASFAIEASGARIGTAYECTLAASIAGLRFEERAVSDGNGFWLDSGDGFQQVGAADDSLASVVELCPVSASFWDGFDLDPIEPSLIGEAELLGDVPTLRYDLTDALGLVQGFGLVPELEGVEVQQITIWLADPDEWLAGFAFEALVSAAAAAETFELPVPVDEGETSRIAMSITVAEPDAAVLTIAVPG